MAAEMEDFLTSRTAGEASGAAPRRLGGLIEGGLDNDDDDDDAVDEATGEDGDEGRYEGDEKGISAGNKRKYN